MSKKSKYPLRKIDRWILKYVPKLFEILGWAAILGVLRYISLDKELISALVIYGIGLILFSLYIQVYIFYEVLGKKYSSKKGIYLLIGAVSGLSMFWLLESIMPHFS